MYICSIIYGGSLALRAVSHTAARAVAMYTLHPVIDFQIFSSVKISDAS